MTRSLAEQQSLGSCALEQNSSWKHSGNPASRRKARDGGPEGSTDVSAQSGWGTCSGLALCPPPQLGCDQGKEHGHSELSNEV